jgi:hypothetical protein
MLLIRFKSQWAWIRIRRRVWDEKRVGAKYLNPETGGREERSRDCGGWIVDPYVWRKAEWGSRKPRGTVYLPVQVGHELHYVPIPICIQHGLDSPLCTF